MVLATLRWLICCWSPLGSELKAFFAHSGETFYNAMSKVSASQGQFQQALSCEKRAFRIESDLIKHIPISELGAAQLRRLSRFELQLKLILSEIENKELKETTKQHKNTVAQLQQDVFTDPLPRCTTAAG